MMAPRIPHIQMSGPQSRKLLFSPDAPETNIGLSRPLLFVNLILGTNPTLSFPGVKSKTSPPRFAQNCCPKTLGISSRWIISLNTELGQIDERKSPVP